MIDGIPKTLEEAFEYLESREGHEDWIGLSEGEAMGGAHHGIGMYMRNQWGLWKKEGELYEYFVGLGLDHADDMSGIILTSFHRKMNGKDLDIDSQVAKYLKHWEDMKVNE